MGRAGAGVVPQQQRLVRTLPLDTVPAALIDAARLPSGALHDDIAVIVAG
jgi:hypothetical protein